MSTTSARARRDGTRGASLILAAFAISWWIAGASALTGPLRVVVAGAGVVIGVALFVIAGRKLNAIGEQQEYERNRRRFAVVNVAQGLLIGAVIVGANVADRQALIPGLIAIVVGLHFLPLAQIFDWREYTEVGLLMIAVGVIGLAPLASPEVTRVFVCCGCALVLWGLVAWLLWAASGTRDVTPSG